MLNLPSVTKDQTIKSLVAAAWLNSPCPGWNYALKFSFGDANVQFNSALNRGWKRAHECFRDLGYETPEAFINAHSYLPIFKHALGANGYESLLQDVLGDRIRHLTFVSLNRVIRTGRYRFCQACVDEALESRTYACALRTHQIPGVVVCPDHDLPLMQCADRVLHIDTPLQKGIVIPPCTLASVASGDEGEVPAASNAFARRYARFVQDALRGRLAAVSSSAFQDAIHAKLHMQLDESLSHESALASRIEREVPLAIRAELDSVMARRASDWPLKLLDGSLAKPHPLASLLVIALVFDDVSEFNRYAEYAGRLRACHLDEVERLRYGHQGCSDMNHAQLLDRAVQGIRDKIEQGHLSEAQAEAADVLTTLAERDRSVVGRVLACFTPDQLGAPADRRVASIA